MKKMFITHFAIDFKNEFGKNRTRIVCDHSIWGEGHFVGHGWSHDEEEVTCPRCIEIARRCIEIARGGR
jgi:hypothetical protein